MSPPVIDVHGLTRTFGRRRGVTDLTFEVRRGEVFGFLGPNGAGKSTTIRLLLGLYHATSGHARVLGGHPMHDAVAIHARLGYLPGELALFPRLTGRQLLDRHAGVRGLRDLRLRDELADRFGAELDRPAHTLSKGNRQKIGIVAAFMHRPELLVLDEPTSGLDPLLQNEFARLLRETADDGRTVLLSSHDLDEVQRVVDRLAIIREGRIVETDTVEGLRARSPRTVELRFPRPVPRSAWDDVPGVDVAEQSGESVVLSVTGPIGPLLRVAAEHEAVDLTARPMDLDQLFLGYYRTQGKEEVHAQARH